MLGKTIARVDRKPDGGDSDDAVVLHFSDGSALRVVGHSYEEVSLSLDELAPADVRRAALRRQGERENQRLERLRRQEWLAQSCEVRAVRRDARRRQSPFSVMMDDTMQGMMLDMVMGSGRFYGAPERTVRLPCAKCGERLCENAPTKTYPAIPEPPLFGGITVEMGQA